MIAATVGRRRETLGRRVIVAAVRVYQTSLIKVKLSTVIQPGNKERHRMSAVCVVFRPVLQ